MELDFSYSKFPTQAGVLQSRDEIISKAHIVGEVPPKFREDADRLNHRYPSVLFGDRFALEPDALQTLRKLKHVISITCQPVMPAILACLIDMRDRLEIPLYIHHSDKSGVAQVRYIIERVHQGIPFDIAFVPNAAFLQARYEGSRFALTDQYGFAMPVHFQKQHIVRRRHKDKYQGLDGINFVRFLADGSAAEQYFDLKKQRNPNLLDQPYDLVGYEKIALFEDQNIALAVWDPISRYILKSGKFILADVPDYNYWASLFFDRATFADERSIRALISVFVSSWQHCRTRRYEAAMKLKKESVVEDFEHAAMQTPTKIP